MEEDDIIWNIIDCYFKSNQNWPVKHHIDSYNSFFKGGLKRLFQEKNPIRILKEQNPKTKKYKYQCDLYLGGKEGNLIYYGKPIIYDEDRAHFMYPNEARLRNMTYGFSIHYDVHVEYKIIMDGKLIVHSVVLPKIYLGRFPIMLQSDLCILKGLSTNVRFNMGECRNDFGGYFIIDGKEKVIVSQEKFADNMLYITDKEHKSAGVIYSHAAKIRSVSEDASKPTRTLAIRIVAPSATLHKGQIVVDIPQVRKPIPLFILMRALGVISDKEIIQTCLLDMEENKEYLELFRPSIHDAGIIFTQQTALKFIGSFIKLERTSVGAVMQILSIYLLPHMGELNFKQKAFYIGYVVKRLLDVYIKKETATDRDNFKFKRIETSGELISQLFKEYYNLQWNHIYREIDKDYYYHAPSYQDLNFYKLIENNVSKIFSQKIVNDGFKKAFKGNWGAQDHTKRSGIIQDLSRLSYFGFISHLRKLNVPLPADAKVVGPRLLHGTQWGIECPIHTPDGGNIGLHKHLSIITHISSGTSGYPFISLLRKMGMTLLEESSIEYLSKSTKVFINGTWVGVIKKPRETVQKLKTYRRNGLMSIFTSIQWDITKNEIIIATDKGRAMRPIFYIMGDDLISWGRDPIVNKIKDKSIKWEELVMGIGKKKIDIKINNEKIYNPNDVFSFKGDETQLIVHGNVIDYLDTQEAEGTFIAMNRSKIISKKTTHVEIHPSLVLGIMANMVIFPENNPLPRDLFSCGQSKQAVSLYNTNYQNRIDKMGIILNYGQIPLVKSRFLKIATKEQHPYGENAIVAIACYSGYNVEDAIIVNKGALERGLFRTTYFNMYEAREESSEVAGSNVDSKFCNIHNSEVIRLKLGYDYSHLNEHGIITENTKLNDKIVLIGKCTTDITDVGVYSDSSVVPKKGQLGYVDKSFMTEQEEGFRLAKVRVRHERLPAIGDKFCSRAGQKGTIGIIMPEEDMPFSANGIRPDIIVNPHAFPSRMTIGHLIECLMGKACALNGSFGDCTAWNNIGPKDLVFGKMLTQQGFHSSGTEVLYNGMTGDQIEADIYFGPTYYLRLKHMVKDKINYRARGPRTVLTRQTVQGRANNGGLRIGEMDRDAVVAHGMTGFLEESMMERGDKYFIAICNQTGSVAVYNEDKNIFLSPMSDGPLKFSENLDNTLNIVNISRFGRDFSVVRVPYSFKLLYQELKTMNIQMRIITEDNIDNLTNIIKSDNIFKLTELEGIKDVMSMTISKLTGKPFTEAEKLTELDQLEEKSEEKIELTEDDEQGEDNEDAIITFNNKEICLESVKFRVYNPKYPNVKSDMPYALDQDELKEKVIDKFIIRPQNVNSLDNEMKTNIEDKLNIDFFNYWTNNGKLNTLDYLFNKIRAGYYLKIQNQVLKEFIPIYNVHFKNTWGHLLNIDRIKRKERLNQNREQWVATNCLLQLEFEPLIDNYNLDTFLEMKNMFSELCAHRNIPDIDLFVNVKDFPLLKKDLTEPFNHIYNSKTQPIQNPKDKYYPILSFNSNTSFTDIPIPTNHEWQVVTQKVFPSRCMNDYKYPTHKITWIEKQPTAIFRGTATGCSPNIEGNPRLKAAKLDKEWSKDIELNGEKEGEYPYLNAGITKFPNRYKTMEGSPDVYYSRDPEYVANMKKEISMKKHVSMQNQSRYKYILNIQGNSAAYRLSYLLRSGSVILNVESENKLWWEDKWEPMKHYVPIKSDLSDLKEKIEWCREHDEECRKISIQANSFADQYITKDAIFNYLETIVNNILLKASDNIEATMQTELGNSTITQKKYRVNIIVPFRDGGDQTRTKHLELFRDRMSIFIPKVVENLTAQGWDAKFDVTVIEQSPEHSFNRGALLNIGFKLDETYDAYIFHDVDLIPEDIMIPVYAGPYGKNAVAHFASEWGRYKNPYKYLGGVLLVGGEVFKRANGFPNNYYGWGGEDDELRRRFETLLGDNVQEYVTLVGKPGGLRDLEQIETAGEKLQTIQDKNPVRWEGKAKHNATWRENGLNQSDFYEIISQKDGQAQNIQYKIITVKLNYGEIPPFETDQQVEEQHKKPFIQSGGAMPRSAMAKSTMPNLPNAEKAALLDREFNKKINEMIQTKEQLMSEFKPKETIMFKETPKEKEFSVEDLGQDIREKHASITIHNQFPVKDVTPVRQFPSVIEEDLVNVAQGRPSPEEAKMERIKRRTEIGGLKWDRDTINNLKK